jgi:hypothetical protein
MEGDKDLPNIPWGKGVGKNVMQPFLLAISLVNKKHKRGLNCLSIRFKSIMNKIDKQWINVIRGAFKTKCKRD